MITFITIIHVLMCIILIAIVLLQTGKGADIGAAFGGASQTLFGGAGPANFLNRVTTVAAVVFMLTSLGLTLLSTHRSASSIVDRARQTQQSPAPEQPSTPPQSSTQGEQPPLENPSNKAVPIEEKPVTQPSTSQESRGSTSTGPESKGTSEPSPSGSQEH
ncbi:MAG TPA: preprotein translocase subunit SecG [Candidatus Limnocylindrales bacterium]|nr:preprotein translocase subunit SecG [Candidatus Limnocylindrales bacterium]